MMVDGRLYHLGFAVHDVDAAMDAYRSILGIDRFHRLDTHYPARHRDWEGIIANRNAFGRIGDLVVELVEPGEGHGPAHEYLESRGEGMFHMGYATPDPARCLVEVERCFEVRSTARPDGTCGIVYLDTLDALGYFVELVETPIADRVIESVDQAGR